MTEKVAAIKAARAKAAAEAEDAGLTRPSVGAAAASSSSSSAAKPASASASSSAPSDKAAADTKADAQHDKRKDPARAISTTTKVAVKSAYKNIVKGKLSLKGGAAKLAPAIGVDKAKKKKASAMAAMAQDFQAFLAAHPDADEESALAAAVAKQAETDAAAAKPDAGAAAAGDDNSRVFKPDIVDRRTKAEINFANAQAAREKELINSKIAKTHRQRIEEFNQLLANMSEHHDIPRVGPG